jgi:hypothetical protein
LYVSGYFGRDVLEFQNRFGIDWGNVTGTVRWNHTWNDKLFSNTSLIYSDYDYKATIKLDDDEFGVHSVIRNFNLKHKFQYYPNYNNTLTFGLSSQYHIITPGQVEVSEDSELKPIVLEDRYAMENALFVGNKWNASDKFKLNVGVRLNHFSLLGPGEFYTFDNQGEVLETLHYKKGEIVQSYLNIEPRLNVTYIFNDNNSIKASYTRNTQNLHLIQNSSTTSPTDIWITSSHNVKPEISDQVSLGLFKNINNNTYEFSGELYYRKMQNQLDLRNGAEIRANELISGQLLFGDGRSYGLETMLKKKQGKLNGWLSYTLSRTERQIEGINKGSWYPARQDATHDISVVGIYDLSDKWTLSATWVYNTGNAVTFPSGKYEVDGNTQFYYTERNGYRMPDYHRLDIGATLIGKKTDKFESSWNFSIYNAYGRKNAYTIDFVEDPNDPTKTIAEKTYLFTYIPSISYNFKF